MTIDQPRDEPPMKPSGMSPDPGDPPPSVVPMTHDSAAVHSSPADASPPRMAPETLGYATHAPPAPPNPWGPATLAFGLASLLLPPLIPVTWICGLVGLVSRAGRPGEREGRGQMAMGLLASLAACVVGVIVFDVLPRSRSGLSRRTVCAANLKGIATGFYTYGNENNDRWPLADHAPAIMNGMGKVDYTATIGLGPDAQRESTSTSTVLSTTRNLWTLIRSNASTPKSFICPSSDDAPNNADNPQVCWDFGGTTNAAGQCVAGGTAASNYTQVSYGYQVPYGQSGVPGSNLDPKMILAADKGPFGANIEAGKSAPGNLSVLTTKSTTNQWMRFNSPNHAGGGQNVMFTDGHVQFVQTASAGINDDNIYTRWGTDGATVLDRLRGAPPTHGGRETPMSDTDTFIYP